MRLGEFLLVHPERARPLHNAIDLQLQTRAAIQLNAGKTRVWNRAGIPRSRMIWEKAFGALRESSFLGSPIWSEAFVQAFTERRLESEQRLWNAVPSIPDLQCAWQLLQCVGRCNHLLRTVPPSQSAAYAAG